MTEGRESIHVKLPRDLVAKLRAAADKSKNPYAPTVTSIIEQGAEKELKRLEKQK